MADILVGQIGHAHDGTLFDTPFDFVGFIHANHAHLKAPGLVFLDDFGFVNLDFLNVECRADHICVVAHIILEVSVFLGCLPHSEYIVLLKIPHITLVEGLQSQCSCRFVHILLLILIAENKPVTICQNAELLAELPQAFNVNVGRDGRCLFCLVLDNGIAA